MVHIVGPEGGIAPGLPSVGQAIIGALGGGDGVARFRRGNHLSLGPASQEGKGDCQFSGNIIILALPAPQTGLYQKKDESKNLAHSAGEMESERERTFSRRAS